GRINWQRNGPEVLRFRIGKISQPVSELPPIVWLEMQRYEVDAGANSLLIQGGNKLVAIDSQFIESKTQNVEVPRTFAILALARRLKRIKHLECFGIKFGDATACFAHRVALLQLDQTQG